jgi:hypothetical protein
VVTQPPRVLFGLRSPAGQSSIQRKAYTCLTADRPRLNAASGCVGFEVCEKCANVHALTGNNCNQIGQDRIVLVKDTVVTVYTSAVAATFNTALRWHMERFGPGPTELAKATGVSVGSIKQMRARPDSSTSAEKAAAIARYYGKSVKTFIECVDETEVESALEKLLQLLTPDERAMLEAQVRGMLASPARRSNP